MFEECGRQMDNRACLYYKITHEPKGSGELKQLKIFINFLLNNCCNYPKILTMWFCQGVLYQKDANGSCSKAITFPQLLFKA